MEDQGIVHLYLQRSQQAILETKKKYGAYCRVIARNIISNLSDVEECENDAYLAAWNAIPPNLPRNFPVFLGRITRNIALDKYGYNTAQKRNREFEVILTELEECLASPDTVETEYEEGEIASLINQFLYSIDEQARNIFIGRYWYSYSIEELSMRFNMSSSKVKSILFRTRKKLRIHLNKEGVNL
ncbi:RNA polymerase sigma-70 factor, ECF subfamily protein [Paenibacillus sp. FSL R5-0345]|uniref:RNA polymerase sigma factor n=1 Tax=Paenibacillus sp. FSL R5-0345 TaxID=1536770 RepID=UPI0004F64F1C|nr:sigma-70 family RNA polymerase sigma factor [Paenibacillus sp. FSL R5-0345]AIQ37610.1 RNA polymerase sigma-70 factor, ECF subfamily protein [Paenibacillus sp. FSL R5-0345]